MSSHHFLGIKVPSQKTKDGKKDEYAEQALNFTRTRVLQYNVKIDVDNVDKGSNFIGNLFTNKQVRVIHIAMSVYVMHINMLYHHITRV